MPLDGRINVGFREFFSEREPGLSLKEILHSSVDEFTT